MHLGYRACSQRLTSQVKGLERALATERAVSSKMREQLQLLRADPVRVHGVGEELLLSQTSAVP